MEVHSVSSADEMRSGDRIMNVLDLKDVDLSTLVRGRVSAAAGKAAYEAIEKGTMLTLQHVTDAIVTSALNKDALNQAGYHFPGHTQILAHLCGVRDAVMMLTADALRIVHVSTHVSLRDACDLVTKERILRVMQLGVDATRAMGVEKPRVVVPGLNPHSGEGGLFGTEEEAQVIPAIEEAKGLGFDVRGPLPLTLGLPIIRTSVDHGTVFGKAGKGTADPTSMIEAIKLAATMCRTRRQAG